MMSRLNKEIVNIQNPALGSYLIWNFIRGYYNNTSKPIPILLIFIVLPMVYRSDVAEILVSTQKKSGLRYFSNKFTGKGSLKNDLLLNIHSSAFVMHQLTYESMIIGLNSILFSIDYERALLFPVTTTEHKTKHKSIDKLSKASEKLGVWCSELTLHEISSILKVRF